MLFLRPVRETAEDKIENKTFLFTIGHAEEATDHSVPVPWTEYLPVSRTSLIAVDEKDGADRPPLKEGEIWRRSIVISQIGKG